MKVKIEQEIGATPTETESQVVDILIRAKIIKKHVLFLKPNRQKGSRTPDIQIDFDLKWEIKSPTGNGKYTIEHAVQFAGQQSKNVIFDLRKSKMPAGKALRKLMNEFAKRREIHRLIVITKSEKVLDYEK
jgi:hypothetical protein